MTQTQLRWGAVGLVLIVLFLLSGSHLCDVAYNRSTDLGSRPIEISPIACTEFWLNRYQTLIGAIVAIGAALYAGKLVRSQILAAEKQTRLTRIQVAFDSIPKLQERVVEANGLIERYGELMKIIRSCEACQQSIINQLRNLLPMTTDERISSGAGNRYTISEDAHRYKDGLVKMHRDRTSIVENIDLNKFPDHIRESFKEFAEFVRAYLLSCDKFYDGIINRRELQLASTVTEDAVEDADRNRPATSYMYESQFKETFDRYGHSAQKLYDLTMAQTDELFEAIR